MFCLQIQYSWLHRSCGPDAALPILPENGLSNRIRGLFENIVSKVAGSRCPLIWRMYMHFLVRMHTKLHYRLHYRLYLNVHMHDDINKCGCIIYLIYVSLCIRNINP